MRTKLMLEALVAWLALAAASGQAGASIQTGANSVLRIVSNPEASLLDEVPTPYSGGKVPANGSVHANADVALLTSAATDRRGTRAPLTTGVHALASSPFRVDAPHSNATFGFSPSGADDFTPGRKNGFDTELKRRAAFNPHDVIGASQGVLGAANGGSDLNAEKYYLVAYAKLAPGPTVPVPEPGHWATVLAGLLGVIAIARRRMSL
jgi:hypothetical protein